MKRILIVLLLFVGLTVSANTTIGTITHTCFWEHNHWTEWESTWGSIQVTDQSLIVVNWEGERSAFVITRAYENSDDDYIFVTTGKNNQQITFRMRYQGDDIQVYIYFKDSIILFNTNNYRII